MTNHPSAMPAIITPFDDHGDFDASGHGSNVAALVGQGAEGIVVAGSTGEGPYLEPGERQALVAATRATAPTVFIVCGINAESERQAIVQIREAADGGADAVLIATPGTLVRNKDPEIERFYSDVADRSPLPVFLYTVPKVTGYILPTSMINTLAGHDNIVGVKDSGGDPSRILEISGPIAAGFVVYAGASRAVLDSVRSGAHGAITASANYVFPLVAGAVDGGDEAQTTLTELTSVVEVHGVPGTKAAAGQVGRINGQLRRPLIEVSAAEAAAIKAALDVAQR